MHPPAGGMQQMHRGAGGLPHMHPAAGGMQQMHPAFGGMHSAPASSCPPSPFTGSGQGALPMVPLLPVANPEGVTPGFAERFSALHAELVNTILSELSCNPDMPRETQQSLLAQLQTSISHTKQPAANAWRTFGVGGAPRLLAISGEDPHAHHPHQQPHVAEVRQLSSIRGDICVGGQLGDPSSGLVKPADQYPAGPALDEDSVSFRALTRLFRDPQALGHLTESASEGSSENTRHKSLAAGVKVKLRHLLLRQNKFTNRFEGSSFARHAEITYASEVTRTQLPSLKRRLAFFAFLLPTISLAHAPRRMDSGLIILQQGLSIIAPAVLLLAAAWICSRREVQSCWRWVVVAAILLADSCNICSDALIPFDNFTPRDKDFHLLWELARFLVMLCACSMASLCGLNFSHVLVLFGAHFLPNPRPNPNPSPPPSPPPPPSTFTLPFTLSLTLTPTLTLTRRALPRLRERLDQPLRRVVARQRPGAVGLGGARHGAREPLRWHQRAQPQLHVAERPPGGQRLVGIDALAHPARLPRARLHRVVHQRAGAQAAQPLRPHLVHQQLRPAGTPCRMRAA